MNTSWQRAQKAEIDCWVANQGKIATDVYQAAKRTLWVNIFNKLMGFVQLSELQTKQVLEFGSGPTGVFMLIPENRNFICLDPLMNDYLQNFPSMRDSQVRFINGKLENFERPDTFDIILGFNAIDHVDDIQDALRRLKSLCRPDTRVVLSVNVHRLPPIQRMLSWLYPIVDKLHKYQYTSSQYQALFTEAGFRIINEINLDPELYHFEQALGAVQPPVFSWRRLISPAFWFFQILHWLGYPRHLYQNLTKGRAIYAAQCYLLTPIIHE